MNKQKIMKWALPALLMSALTFEIMAGGVKRYVDGKLVETAYNFFTIESETTAAYCLPIAGMVTFVAMMLALVSACFKKHSLYKATSWSSLAAGALAAVPYIAQTEGEAVQPNVIVILILTGCWLLAISLDRKKDDVQEKEYQGRRL